MAYVTVAGLDPATAAAMLAGVERYCPRGTMTAQDVAAVTQRGLCFAATHPETNSQGVYVLEVENGQAWIALAHGTGPVDFTRTMLPAIELQASELDSVAFQTMRPGLARKAQKLGYRVTGWILKKELRHGR